MKKLLYCVSLALALFTGVSLSSCDKDTRSEILGNLIDDGLDYLSRDSTTWLAGTWAASEGGLIDTLWIGKDSTFSSHTIMIDKETDTDIDLFRTGGYLYYMSFGQVLVNYSYAYNFKTEKPLEWDEIIIYNAKKFKITVSADYKINNLTLEELDQVSGESLGTTTYSYVSDNTKSPYAE